MRLEIKGDIELYRKFNSLDTVLKKTFWGLVRTDLEKTLLENVKPHHQTGKLERNVYSKTTSDGVEAGISNENMMTSWGSQRINYAVFVNYGSRPHEIKAKNKKSLRWVGAGGRFMFAKSVQHPGYKGSHFIENTAKDIFSRLDKHFTTALKNEGVI